MDFTGVHLKLDRASHHLETLKAALADLLYADPDTGARVVVRNAAQPNTWETVTYRPDDFLPAWSVLVGEVAYQLRSTLDHLINGLIPECTRESGFPIFCTESGYDAHSARLLPGLATPYLAFVRNLQPFRQVPGEAMSSTLWNLNEWARLDRHRFLHVADIWVTQCRVASVPEGRVSVDHSAVFPSPLEDRAVIGSGRTFPERPEAVVEVQVEVVLDLVLSQLDDMRIPQGMMAVQAVGGLEAFVDHVQEILAGFELIAFSM